MKFYRPETPFEKTREIEFGKLTRETHILDATMQCLAETPPYIMLIN